MSFIPTGLRLPCFDFTCPVTGMHYEYYAELCFEWETKNECSIANCPYFHRDTSVDDGATCFDSETESSGHGTPELKSKVLDLNDTDAFPALSTPAVPVLEKSKKKEKKNKRAASPAVTIMVTDEDGYEGTLSSSSSFSWSQPIELNVSDISFTPREYKLTPPPGLYYMFRRNVTELIPLSLLGALDCE